MRILSTVFAASLLSACGGGEPVRDFTTGYEQVLESTPGKNPPGTAHMERFKAFMADLNADTIPRLTREIYAPDAYLNDNLIELRGAAAIEAHFAKSLEGLSAIEVRFDDTVRSGDDWYVRWTMSTTFRSLADGATVVTSGMSHIRFDEQGRVTVHRDFWDSASGVYEHVPVLGGAIRAVKARATGG